MEQDGAALVEQQQQAVSRFGVMLRRWREQNGWTQHTASQWAKEAGFKALDAGSLSKLESGKVPHPRNNTFFLLADLNRRIASKQWGVIRSAAMRQRLIAAMPIVDADGQPWLAKEFWAAFVGLQAIPERLLSTEPEHLDEDAAAQLSAQWQALFREIEEEFNLDPVAGLQALSKELPIKLRKRINQVLLSRSGAQFTVEELQQQWNGHWLLDQALQGMREQLEAAAADCTSAEATS
jgi:transcriptional regulator with XRE-family HTH domain